MRRAIIKNGVCVKSSAMVRVLEYGKVAPADIFLVGDCLVLRFPRDIHQGEWAANLSAGQPINWTHTLCIGLDGFVLEETVADESRWTIVVPHDRLEGELDRRPE